MSTGDNGVVEPIVGAVAVSGGGDWVSGGGACVSTGVPVGIWYWPKAFVSWAKMFAVEKPTSAAAASVMPVFWKPCILITHNLSI